MIYPGIDSIPKTWLLSNLHPSHSCLDVHDIKAGTQYLTTLALFVVFLVSPVWPLDACNAFSCISFSRSGSSCSPGDVNRVVWYTTPIIPK